MSISSPKVSQASRKPPVLTNPVRYPQSAPAPVRTKRAFVLLLLTLLLPGSAQIVAGNRKLGRLALRVTFGVWLVVVLALAISQLNRGLLFSVFTNPFSSLLLIAVLVLLALGWAYMFLNTLRLIRPALLAPGMRGTVSVVLVLLMVLTSGSVGYSAYLINTGRNAINSIFSAGPDMAPVDGRYNFLVMGGDAGADRVGRRPDSIIVVSVDASSGQAVTISIPRNLQNAQFTADSPMRSVYPNGYNCGDNCIINFLYTEVTEKYANLYPGRSDPGAAAMMDAAGGTLGLKIQGYLLIDMSGFSRLIDALGGVKINAGGWVPISGASLDDSGYSHAPPEGWIAPGEQTLNGQQALWYARSRQWVLEYARSERQQCIQQALLKQMDPATVLSKFESILNAGTKVMESDIPAAQLGSFVDLALKSKKHPLKRLTIGPPDFDINFSTFPDFNVIHARVQELIAGNSPAPTTGPEGAAPAPAAPDASTAAPAAPAPAPAAPAPGPQVTQEYLQQLAEQGDDAMLESLLANNGSCTAG
ncbi:LCP family protein [Paeniglutamicibacter antarcticus]|uniref:LCP family protein n=1 Tax=Arthrobacter terrae TaxID=2935737 RepID=A0A931G6G5_9MICC|nr:LCP family protein [Arthrobacter terrae]MBG0738284.1 LCP family protein [Arthrobacter terrae]